MDADPGTGHLRWIARFQAALLALGLPLWLLRSWRAPVAFLAGGLTSLVFWNLHRWIVARMLTPSVRLRWLYGLLVLLKLALIVLVLRGMMVCFPTEAVPLATGILLFAAAILLEAARLMAGLGTDD